MLGLVLTAVLAADGGVKLDAPLYATCPDAPPAVEIDGGLILLDPRPARIACLMATCEADRQAKAKDNAQQTPPPSWVQVATSVAVAVGAVITAVSPRVK